MFNLYEILRNAQGGQAIDNLAAQFNITSEEADAAVKAIVPELSEGFLKQASQPLESLPSLGRWGKVSIWRPLPIQRRHNLPLPRKRAVTFSANCLARIALKRKSPYGRQARRA